MKKLFIFGLIPVMLVALAVMATPLVMAHGNDNNATSTDNNGNGDDDDDDDDVEDVGHVNVNSLPASMGKFLVLGKVTAVNMETRIIAVNGLSMHVMPDAKVRRGEEKSLDAVKDGDRVAASGTVEAGTLHVTRLVVRGQVTTGKGRGPAMSEEKLQELRRDINSRMQDILRRIAELQEKIDKRLGRDTTATSTQD